MISVIIPVYNSELFIEKCIDSVLAQTYTDWELLLVDDCSRDGSKQLCENYANDDSRIHVFSTDINSGPSKARNIGIDNAKGEWITFIDADDYISRDYLLKLHEVSIEKKADISICAIQNIRGNNKVIHNLTSKKEIVLNKNKKRFIYNVIVYGKTKTNKTGLEVTGPICKLFKRELVNGLRYDENINLGEDTLFCIQIYDRANSIAYINEPLYSRVERENSLSNIINNDYYIRRANYVNRMVDFMNGSKCVSENDIHTFLYTNLKNVIFYYFYNKKMTSIYIKKYENLTALIDYEKVKDNRKLELVLLKNKWYIVYFGIYCLNFFIKKLKGR